MMFWLELHSSHHDQPEQVFVFVVTAALDLMVNKVHFGVFLEPDFFLVVADEDEGWVEACDEFSDDKVYKIFSKIVEGGVVAENEKDLKLNKRFYTTFFDLIEDTRESNLHFRYKN